MEKAPTPAETSIGQATIQTKPQKSSITQRLRTDLGRSVGVTKTTQLVWFYRFSRSSKSCDCVTFRVLKYLLSTSTLYTSLQHDLIKAKVVSLVNWCFNRESKTYLCTSYKAGILETRSMTRVNVGLALSYVKLLLSSWKTYMCNLKAWFINK